MTDEEQMTDEEATLIECVRAGARDARAVYADWLEERGRIDQAMLMRGPRGPVAALADLASWLYGLGDFAVPLRIADGAVAVGMGSDSLAVEPGAEVQMTWRPQVTPFRPTQVVIPEDLAPHFAICDIRVGNRSQLRSREPLHASLFTATSVQGHQGKLSFEVVHTAMDLVLQVVNTSADARPFFALVFGREAQDRRGVGTGWESQSEHHRALLGAWQQIVGTDPEPPRAGEISVEEMATIVARVRASIGSL